MKARREKLGDRAAVKGTMLQAHVAWAVAELGEAWMSKVPGGVDPVASVFVSRGVLATDWVPFRALVEIDRAIARAAGGTPEDVYRSLGRRSATSNLAGAYKGFVQEEPHRFFELTGILHSRFQNFGRFTYERTGERSRAHPHRGRRRVLAGVLRERRRLLRGRLADDGIAGPDRRARSRSANAPATPSACST